MDLEVRGTSGELEGLAGEENNWMYCMREEPVLNFKN